MALSQNKMGTMPIKRLIIHMSWPMMLSMLVQALYNMADSFYVSLIDDKAFIALSLVFPVQMMMIAICVGTGVGVNAMLSRRLGQNRLGEANNVAMNGFFVYLLSWVLFLTFGLTVGLRFVGWFNADPTVALYGKQYLSVVCAASLGMCMQFAAERVLQASGDAIRPMVIQGVGAVINIVLDPILIFGYFGFPAMGVMGAAVATVFGQCVGAVLGILFVKRNRVLTLQVRGFRPSATTIGDIYRVGGPVIVMQSLGTVMTLGLNKIMTLPKMVAELGDAPIFILGAYFKLQSFVFMPVFGMNNGMTPVLSYNYGAREPRRITDGIHFAMKVALAIMAVGTALFLLFPGLLMSIFSAPEETLLLGESALRIIACGFLFAGMTIVLSGAFQALGTPIYSMMLGLLRQLLLILPMALALALTAPRLVWCALPVAEVITCALALLLYRKVRREHIAPLETQNGD